MTTTEFDTLLAAIAVGNPAARVLATEVITDVCKTLEVDQAAVLANRLVALRLDEALPDCQESQLNALGTLKASFQLPAATFAGLARLRDHPLDAEQEEYLAELLEDE